MKREIKRPKVGLSVIVLRDDRVLLGKRKGSHGAGTWSFPGGHIEWGESFSECAVREMREETGWEHLENYMMLDDSPARATNDFFEEENKHYVTLYLKAKYMQGKPGNPEPNKCEGWRWFEWQKLPGNLFLPVRNLVKSLYNPFRGY